MIRKTETGQALALVAVALVTLLGFAGLAIDMGVIRYDKRLQQTAADAAAIAGANELRYDASGVVAAGQSAAGTNGYQDNAGGAVSTCNASPAPAAGTICVQINNPPKAGPHSGDSNYVEALVSAVHPTYFMHVFGIGSETVETRAVATLVGESGDYPGCIYTLGPPGTGVGVTSNGTPNVNAPDCGIYDNGDWTTNGAPVNITAAGIGVVGSSTNHGGGTVTCQDAPNNCPASIAPLSDPLAYLQEQANTPTVGTPVAFNSSVTPVPGTTYSGIDIEGGTVNFPAGTYIVDGNFTINGTSTVTGTGVTFYITGGGAVTVNGTSTVQLSAPDSGQYAGILFYQDPTDTSVAKLNGTNTSYYQGALYFPGAQLEFGGTNFTNSQAQYTVIVADDLKFFGTSQVNINANYSSLPGGVSIIENAVLVE